MFTARLFPRAAHTVMQESRAQDDAHACAHAAHRMQLITSFQKVCGSPERAKDRPRLMNPAACVHDMSARDGQHGKARGQDRRGLTRSPPMCCAPPCDETAVPPHTKMVSSKPGWSSRSASRILRIADNTRVKQRSRARAQC